MTDDSHDVTFFYPNVYLGLMTDDSHDVTFFYPNVYLGLMTRFTRCYFLLP